MKKKQFTSYTQGPFLDWERIDQAQNGNDGLTWDGNQLRSFGCWAMFRLKVPNGWLVRLCSDSRIGTMTGGMGSGGGLTFVPDPDHAWKV